LAAGLSAAEGQVKKSTEAMAAKFASIGKTMTIVGGVITAAFGVIIKKTMEAGDKFDKMSLRTGESVENLSSLAYACDITGTSIEGLEVGIKFLTKGMDDASQGIGLAKDAFEYLGMSVKDTEGNLRPTVEVLKEAATKIAAIENPAKQAALAMDLFGARSGTQLIPLLKLGGAGIDELMNKAKELGITMSTETAKAAAEFKDRLEDLKGSLAGAGRDIAMILIPPLTELTKKAIEIVKKITAWAESHKPLVKQIIELGAILGVLAAVGGPILLAVSAFMKMKAAILAVSAAIKVVTAVMMTNPLGLALVATAALYTAWITNFGGIRDFTIAVVNKIKEVLGWLWDKVIWVAESLGLIKKPIEEVVISTDKLKEANQELKLATDEEKISIGELAIAEKEAGDKAKGAIPDIDDLTTSMGELEDGTDEAKTALDEFGNKIESFDEWVAGLAEKAKEAAEKLADAAEEAMERYENAIKPVEDRLYELSHTEEEVAAKNLLAKKEQLEESVKAAGLSVEKEKAELTKIREWYDKEIGLIISKLEEQQKAEIETANKTEESADKQRAAIRGIKEEYSGLITKIEDVGKAAEAAAKAAEKAAKKAELEVFLAGVPTIAETGYVPSYIPKLQMGIPYVPKTGIYQLHQGEAVIPKNQNTINKQNYSFSPIVNLTVSGSGNASNIAYEVKKVLDESIRQFRRSGFELVPGRG